MAEYSWPGNLRELKNVLERAVILQGGGALDPPGPSEGHGGPESLAEVEKRQIIRALAHTRGHQGRAAEVLGISRKTLWEKRRRYGIP
jgi:transcriptional regulator of acetoin/glycerol metabolism